MALIRSSLILLMVKARSLTPLATLAAEGFVYADGSGYMQLGIPLANDPALVGAILVTQFFNAGSGQLVLAEVFRSPSASQFGTSLRRQAL